MAFQMINVGEKPSTQRRALAQGQIRFDESTYLKVVEKKLPKGDALALAEVAGIQGAKLCSQLLPLCHPLELTSVSLRTELLPELFSVKVEAEVTCFGKTGVEMEALSAVQAGLLCLHDLTKMFDPASVISNVFLVEKEGGKNGHWVSPFASKTSHESLGAVAQVHHSSALLQGVSCGVLTVSDSCSLDPAADKTGPFIRKEVQSFGALVAAQAIVPDDAQSIRSFLADNIQKCRVLILTGGTGIGPRDITPQTVTEFCKSQGGFEIPGIGELLRSRGAEQTSMTWISRSGAFSAGDALILCLPGSSKAVAQGLSLFVPLLPHMLSVKKGGKHA